MLPLSEIFAAFRWWGVLLLLGTAVFPLTWTLFRRLPDRGYAFTRLVGLLLVSYTFWMLGSLGILRNDLGGILISLMLVTAISWWQYRRGHQADEAGRKSFSLTSWLRENWGQVLLTELLFLLIFALWIGVRAQNPSIVSTEKPMEFAFLNAASRTPTMPPLDPWLSGYAISYYYFGYVMMSLLARLAAVPEYIAFNLGIAWLVAGTAVAAFGLVYNLIIETSRSGPEEAEKKERHGWRRLAVALGLVAALALPIAGNQQITMEVLHANGAGSEAFWEWLDVRDINGAPGQQETARYESSSWWWWRSSRVIHEYHLSGRAEEGLEPIVEFPGFSFILGDMHPHVLALPFAFLSLAVAYLWYLQAGSWQFSSSGGIARLKALLSHPLWLFTAILLGGLSFLNTWDILIHLFVVLGAFVLARWRQDGWHPGLPGEAFLLAVSLVVAIFILYLPFYLGFQSQAGAPYLLPMLMRPTRLVHYLIIFGMPLFSVAVLLVSLAARQRLRGWRAGLTTAVSLLLALFLLMILLGLIIAASSAGSGRVTGLAQELGIGLPPHPGTAFAFGWALRAVLAVLPALLTARLAYPALTLLLLVIIALIITIWQSTVHKPDKLQPANLQPATPLPFVLLLVLTGTLLTLGPEFVYLRDNFGVRLNTTFKFYYQAWVLFGVAALFGLGYLWREMKGSALVATLGYGALFALSLLFPYYAVQSRAVEYRGPVAADTRLPPTLDGMAYLRNFNAAEYEAIMWLRNNISGTPVIVEAVGGQYSEYGRFAASTGLPTLLGWPGHEYQWRGSDTVEPAEREPAVQQIYTLNNWEVTTDLLDRYSVSYIIVSSRELSTYGLQAQEKFEGLLPVAFSNEGVTIYRWQPPVRVN